MNERLAPHFHQPVFTGLISQLKYIGSSPMSSFVRYAEETWDRSDGRFIERFPYIEISDVGLGTNEYRVTQTPVSEVPSRARQVVRAGDILVSMTRPNRGAVAKVLPSDDGAIASTGFAIVRDIDFDVMDRDYLMMCLSVSFGCDQMLMRSSGGSYPAITKDELLQVLIPHVSLRRQRQLVTTIDSARAGRKAKLTEAEALLNSIDNYVLDALGITSPTEDSRQAYAVSAHDMKTISLSPQFYAPILQRFLNELQANPLASKPLSSYVEINPRANVSGFDDNDIVGFLPMDSVADSATGDYKLLHMPLKEVKKGFTPFRDGDVLWAKITPCMQNGKTCIVNGLPNRIGYGSTEFHVIRVISKCVSADFVKEFLGQTTLRRLATFTFTGTAGQQRVPADFIGSLPFPVLPLERQNEIVAYIKSVREEARRLRAEAESEWQAAKRWFQDQLLAKRAP